MTHGGTSDFADGREKSKVAPVRNQATIPLGIVVDRRDMDNLWQDCHWAPVAVIPGAGPLAPDGPWTVYLTFDDGPSRSVTTQILDIMADYDVQGTFFLHGHRIENNEDLVQRMIMGTRGVPQDFTGLVPNTLFLAEISSLGWLVVYSGLAVIVGNLLVTAWGDEAAEDNPWGAKGNEWTVASPAAKDNFS